MSLTSTASAEMPDAAAGSAGAAPSCSSGGSGGAPELRRSVSVTSTGGSGGGPGGGDADGGSEGSSPEGSAAEVMGPGGTSLYGMMEDVLREAFLKTDEEFSASGLQAGLVGSTAVVALVGTHRVWIANCGAERPGARPGARMRVVAAACVQWCLAAQHTRGCEQLLRGPEHLLKLLLLLAQVTRALCSAAAGARCR